MIVDYYPKLWKALKSLMQKRACWTGCSIYISQQKENLVNRMSYLSNVLFLLFPKFVMESLQCQTFTTESIEGEFQISQF